MLLASEPRQQQEQREQRQHEKDGASTVVNEAIDHVRADMCAEQSDDQNAKSVPHNAKRNDEGHQDGSSPGTSEKDMGSEQAGDEQHPTGVDPTALLRDPKHNPRQREYGAVAQKRSTGHLEEPNCDIGRA